MCIPSLFPLYDCPISPTRAILSDFWWYCENYASGSSTVVQAKWLLSELFGCYRETKRYDKATAAAAAVTAIQPHNALGYVLLAELYTDQLNLSQRGLMMVNAGIEQMRLSKRFPVHRAEMGSLFWALRGLILQQLGQTTESDTSLQYAWSIALHQQLPILAEVSFRTGQVYITRHDTNMATHYFEQVIATDPGSIISEYATEELKKLRIPDQS